MKAERLSNKSSTPLRYPGGKGKITRFVGDVLDSNHIAGTYMEPFAGGAGVAINLLLTGKVDRIVINDLDSGVFSFWKTVTERPEWLLEKINKVPFDYLKPKSLAPREYIDYWYEVKTRYEDDNYRVMRTKGFDFFMLNRMNVSGIVKGGPVGGRAQNGRYNISARFNKRTLSERIQAIAERADDITVTNFEGSHFCSMIGDGRFGDPADALVFVDPPYYVQGRNLYNSYATERIHQLVAEQLLKENSWKWILTYDEAPEINGYYPDSKVKKYEYGIRYSANKRGKYDEYMFTSPALNVRSFDNVELRLLS